MIVRPILTGKGRENEINLKTKLVKISAQTKVNWIETLKNVVLRGIRSLLNKTKELTTF